ncbi:FAS-associated death domain protein-like [Mercenaria mercenaria]|uniref:FAS-associated death domain protein-like n=1 Tax=Mercenaria mercenaria TaxID=6596 RepID=UPI00234FB14A|nr:FAS-associated death domain protein-like [Mercenaria mercenaria]
MDDQRYAAYKDMLISVADVVDQDVTVLNTMKFKCDRIIKGRERDQIKSAIQLWTALEKREYLGLSKTDFLKELLKSCMRGQVEALNMVENYERLNGDLPGSFNGQAIPAQVNCPGNPQIIYIGQKDSSRQFPQQGREVLGPDLKKEIAFLSKSLGRNWTFFMRELGLPDIEIEAIMSDYKYTKEQAYQCLLLWQDIQKQEATKQRLVNALRTVNRNDLADTLEEGTY